MNEIADVLSFFVETGLVPALAAGAMISFALTAVAVRRRWLDVPVWLAFGAVVSVVGILVLTLFRETALVAQELASGARLTMPGWDGLRTWSPDGLWRATADPLRSTQVLLNVMLFAPAAMLWTVITRRPWHVLAALGVISVGIELVQAVTGLGANDVADIVANVAGAAAGVGVAVVGGWVTDALAGRSVSRRQWWRRGIALAMTVACAAVLPVIGASQRQAALVEEASRQFNGTTLTDVERWERDGELDRVWRGVASSYSDGFVIDAGSATARYPARFLGRRTCVLVTWDQAQVDVRPGSGTICSRTSL